MDTRTQTLEQRCCTGMTGVQKKEELRWRRNDASKGMTAEETLSTDFTRCTQDRLRSSGAQAIIRRTGILYQLLGLALVTIRTDRVLVVSSFGEGLCTRYIRIYQNTRGHIKQKIQEGH